MWQNIVFWLVWWYLSLMLWQGVTKSPICQRVSWRESWWRALNCSHLFRPSIESVNSSPHKLHKQGRHDHKMRSLAYGNISWNMNIIYHYIIKILKCYHFSSIFSYTCKALKPMHLNMIKICKFTSLRFLTQVIYFRTFGNNVRYNFFFLTW